MRKFRQYKMAAPVAFLGVLAGCATPTPYQPLGYPGARGGYTDQQLDRSHWRVSFVGNTLTSRQKVETYLLYRAAELTLQQGFNCFTLVDHQTDREIDFRVNSYGGYGGFGGYYGGWWPYWHLRGPWGWHHYDPWAGGSFFPARYDVDTVESFQAMADIAVSGPPCTTTLGTFNAAEIVENLRPQIVPPKEQSAPAS